MVHLSVHTFTPVLEGKVRAVDVGLLFDPAREGEAALARRWKRGIEKSLQHAPLTDSNHASPPPNASDRPGVHQPPALRIRMNQPYRGVSDGLTTHLRTRFPADRYAGLELEVNQCVFRAGRETPSHRLADRLEASPFRHRPSVADDAERRDEALVTPQPRLCYRISRLSAR